MSRHTGNAPLSDIFADSCCINEQSARHVHKAFNFSLRRPVGPIVLPNQASFDIKLNVCLYNLLSNLMKNEFGIIQRMTKTLLDHYFWSTSDEELHWKGFTIFQDHIKQLSHTRVVHSSKASRTMTGTTTALSSLHAAISGVTMKFRNCLAIPQHEHLGLLFTTPKIRDPKEGRYFAN